MLKKIGLLLCLIFVMFLFGGCADNEVTIKNIDIINIPEEIEIGTFDEQNIKYKVTYSDNKIKEIDVKEKNIPEEYKHYLYEEGTHEFSFLYMGFEVSFKITMYEKKYTVTFLNEFEEVVKTVRVKENEEIIYPTEEEMYVEGYRFLSTFDKDIKTTTTDVTIKGNYVKVWIVNFYNGLNELISTQVIDNGLQATEPTEEEKQVDGYTFVTWDKAFINITKDTNIYGIYEKNDEPLDVLEYELNEDNKSYSVEKYNNIGDGHVVIPATYNDLPVTCIKNSAFESCWNLISVKISDNVIFIGNRAFYGCFNLNSVEIGSGVKNIGNSAFEESAALSDIKIPDGVINIGNNAFYRCLSIKNISIPNSVTNIGEGAFKFCSGLMNIEIGTGINCLSKELFWGCTNLNNIEIPRNITRIESFSLSCEGLYRIYIPSSVTEISMEAFCSKTVVFTKYTERPNGWSNTLSEKFTIWDVTIEEYEKYIFIDNSIYLFDHNEKTVEAVYLYYEKNELIVPKSIEYKDCDYKLITLGEYAFYDENFDKIQISSTIKSIKNPQQMLAAKNFYYEGTLEQWCNINISLRDLSKFLERIIGSISIDMAQNLIYEFTSITYEKEKIRYYVKEIIEDIKDGKYPFWVKQTFDYYLSNFENHHIYMLNDQNEYYEIEGDIELPETITSINDFQFAFFTKIESLHTNYEITNIGKGAFLGCRNLKDVNELILNCSSIKEGTFALCLSLKEIRFDGTDIEAYAFAMCTELERIDTIAENLGNFVCAFCISLDEISICEIKNLGLYAFAGCIYIREIALEFEVLNSNEFNAFAGCINLESVVLPSNIEVIGEFAFQGCISLENVEIPNSVKTIKKGAFYHCTNLTNILLTDNIANIEDGAFINCIGLKSIEIPSSVLYLGPNVFMLCTNLTIYCKMSEQPLEWDLNWNPSNCPVFFE